MFSGLSNQVNSWMGAVKGEPHDEEVPTPTAQQTADAAAAAALVVESAGDEASLQQQQQLEEVPIAADGAEGGNVQSPTKTGGMFSGMKTQMSGWLGNAAIPTMPSMPGMPAMPAMPSMPSIPGLRKGNAAAANAAATEEGGIANEALAASPTGHLDASGIDEDDRSSATEGADSAPVSGAGTPNEEKVGQVGMVTTKVTQGAKTFGSFLYSAVNKAGSKIKESVKDNNILGEFSKEQDAFIKGQQGGADAAVVPWIGHQDEERVKEEILGLSADRRNFVRAPPAGVEFEFNYDVSYPIAVAIMGEDAALEKMRFDLVPKIITEENFWRNYFYRVSLICQAGDLGHFGQHSEDNEVAPKAVNPIESGDSVSAEAKVDSRRTISETEFVSDTFQTTELDLEEVKAGMKRLGIDTLAQQTNTDKDEEHWEKELEAELQDFELVDDDHPNNARATAGASPSDWEKDVDDLLGDCEDLK